MLVAHDWGSLAVGKGLISEDEDKAIFEGKLNLKDPEAQRVHSWLGFDLENGSPKQEWSYGFTLHKDGFESFEDHDKYGDGRWLKPKDDGSPGATVHEVSPVVVGAGEGTGTMAVKENGYHLHFEPGAYQSNQPWVVTQTSWDNDSSTDPIPQKFSDQVDAVPPSPSSD